VEDMLGRKTKVPAKIESIVGIGPGALRLLVYMQVTDRVAGVEEIEKRTGRPYIFAHPELQDRPAIGPAFTGDPELIAARDPDVIFKTYTTRGEADELQKKTGIPVVALHYINPTSDWRVLDSALTLMGRVLNKQSRAEELIQYHHALTDTLEKKTSGIPEPEKPGVYLGGLSHRGTHGINSTSPYYESFAFVHAKNLAGPLRKNYANNEGVMLDMEQLMVWNPQVIFIDLAGRALVEQDIRQHRKYFRMMEAFRESKIYGVHPYNWYSTNYGTVLANAWYIGSVLYPGRFAGVDPAEKANEIYRQFLGRGVYEDLKSEYGGYGALSFQVMNKN
ncbi:MAG: iron ABC transporter substrate-binding protein, partial [Bacteroidales bacterium]|nr:iron ABC transporter substrate-binding protein [Bacteroidales bacterium]